jgi:hypothetical protein
MSGWLPHEERAWPHEARMLLFFANCHGPWNPLLQLPEHDQLHPGGTPAWAEVLLWHGVQLRADVRRGLLLLRQEQHGRLLSGRRLLLQVLPSQEQENQPVSPHRRSGASHAAAHAG